MRRALRLRKETLSELVPAELASVAGGQTDTCIGYSLLTTGCFCSGMFPSLNIDCPVTGRPCVE